MVVAKAGCVRRVGTRYRAGCTREEGCELDLGAVGLMRPRSQPSPGRRGSDSIRAGGAALRDARTGQRAGMVPHEEAARPMTANRGRNASIWGFT